MSLRHGIDNRTDSEHKEMTDSQGVGLTLKLSWKGRAQTEQRLGRKEDQEISLPFCSRSWRAWLHNGCLQQTLLSSISALHKPLWQRRPPDLSPASLNRRAQTV